MTLAVLTFVVTLSMVLGAYWALVVRPEAQVTGRLRKRLEIKADRPVGSTSVVKGARRRDERGGLLGQLAAWYDRYTLQVTGRLIESAGMRTDPKWLIGGTAIAFTFVQIVLQIAHAGAAVSLLAAVMTPLVPYFYIKHAAHSRLRAFEEMFPDAINLMSRALRAGHALTTTLSMVADEMADPVKSEFRALHEQHTYGLPFTQVMRTFAKRVPLMDVRFFAIAVLTQRETGGNLAEVLDNLAGVMRDRFRVRRQLRVLTAQGRMSGWILGALPVVLGVALFVLNPGPMQAFVTDPTGLRLLLLAAGLEIAGVIVIRQILRTEY
jgi:tight adherence protein B